MIDPRDREQVGAALLVWLRERLACDRLGFAEPPRALASGNQNTVYGFRLSGAPLPFDGALVLRLGRHGEQGDRAGFEAAVQNALADQSLPVPRVLEAGDGPSALGGPFQIMQRVPGRALLLGGTDPDVTGLAFLAQLVPSAFDLFRNWPARLAEAQVAVHGADRDAFCAALLAAGFDTDRLRLRAFVDAVARDVDDYAAEVLGPARDWLWKMLPGDDRESVCHGDFFPNQVFAHAGRVSGVIDWSDVRLGPPEFDIGLVDAGIRSVPLPRAAADWLADRALRAYRARAARPLDEPALRYGRVYRCVFVLSRVARYEQGGGPRPVPYDDPRATARLHDMLGGLLS